jgi:predicted ABC-type ATPase
VQDAPPTVVILGRPNGAGKTTAARTVLAEKLRLVTYVNADVIAQGLVWQRMQRESGLCFNHETIELAK